MTPSLLAKSTIAAAAWATFACAVGNSAAWAQNFPITAQQKDTAQQVARAGVPLRDIAPNAPERYTVKRGDTLWGISRMYLTSPWRWPELWGMNLDDIKNPHRIYPGQVLVLERSNGMATLRLEGSGAMAADGEPPSDTIRVSPQTRYESLADAALPTLNSGEIAAFLSEGIITSQEEFDAAPRIVAVQDGRVLLTRGDRAYVRSSNGTPLLDDEPEEKKFRIYRKAIPLKDPITGKILGYEGVYAGKATLVRGETTAQVRDKDGREYTVPEPATIDITAAKGEIRASDRLLPEPAAQQVTYTPRAPSTQVQGNIVSIYGTAVVNAAQSQVVAINLGAQDGMEVGHVLAILQDGARVVDKTDASLPLLKLPNERNGLLMVFRTFDRMSYALILEITNGVRVGDRIVNPR